ncbi:putative monovalent cation/H+ antiporter subunit E [Corynebacterium kalinowskii]|uniref:Monovalent cation/H+ antiporter subunit E n=1 Tax=Corynebacterium kalinowskii TaxID=2675216 RepID=A0A6B8VN82_9CORY|nr:Na+/H+ antiporter subunit E [Corynebacterium kalinowskii]QGU01231.1 putative monovalent cation/H+ antiporter subunit E [Corynebacterium kalinowskii]
MISGFRRRFRPFTVAWITLMWCLMYGEFSWANVIGGLLVGVAIVLLFPLPALPIAALGVRWGALVGLGWFFVKDLVDSSIRVSILALRPSSQPPSAIIKVPMRVQEDFVFSLAVSLLNLTPGGSVMELDISGRMLTMHILNARSTGELQRSIDGIAELEKRLIRVFEKGN